MRLSSNTKFFLAFLVLLFVVQVVFGMQSSWEPETAFVNRLAVAILVSAGATFVWNYFRPRR